MCRVRDYCERASQEEIFDLFSSLCKSLIKQRKIKNNSSFKELNTKFKNKKHHDSFYSKSYNDNRMYQSYLDDVKITLKYIL